MLMRQFGQAAGVIVRDQVGNGPANIPQETLRKILSIDPSAGEGRQIRYRAVPPTRLELFNEVRGAVLEANFPTVNVRRFKRAITTCARDQPGQESLEVRVYGFPAQFIAFESHSTRAGGVVLGAHGGVC